MLLRAAGQGRLHPAHHPPDDGAANACELAAAGIAVALVPALAVSRTTAPLVVETRPGSNRRRIEVVTHAGRPGRPNALPPCVFCRRWPPEGAPDHRFVVSGRLGWPGDAFEVGCVQVPKGHRTLRDPRSFVASASGIQDGWRDKNIFFPSLRPQGKTWLGVTRTSSRRFGLGG